MLYNELKKINLDQDLSKENVIEKIKNALKKEHLDEYEKWKKKNFDVNHLLFSGGTLLHLASKSGYTEIVKLLVEKGADVNTVDDDGRTALHQAAIDGYTDIVKLLVEKGADINAVDGRGSTPLYAAAIGGYTEIVKLLVEKGADVNVADNCGWTALHAAAHNGHTEIVKLLVEKGADINAADKHGQTPLKFAVMHNKIDSVKVIVNHIAKLDAAGLYVSQENSQLKSKFTNSTPNNYSQYFQKCKEEVEKLTKENKLHDFLKESNINELASIWEKNENIRNKLDDQENLQKQYPEYANILINKANEVKKEIFLHNHKPLTDVLKKHYKRDFDDMNFAGIKTFFDVHKEDFRNKEIGVRNNTLINFRDFKDVKEKHIPKLKVQLFAKSIKESKKSSTVLDNPNAEQPQEQAVGPVLS